MQFCNRKGQSHHKQYLFFLGMTQVNSLSFKRLHFDTTFSNICSM